jgi:hypothetical protein
MDHFLVAAQLCHFSRAIHDMFPPSLITNSNMPDPISITKLHKENIWSPFKEMLGWQFNGITRTINITNSKADKLKHKLHSTANMHCIKVKVIEELHGSLQHLAQALPLGKPTLSMLSRQLHAWLKHNQHLIQLSEDIKQLL